jgi:DNA-binding Lrp family transcriptional regulator
MNKKKLLYSILAEIKQSNEPKAKDYGLSIEEFGSVVEMAKDEGYIKNAGVSRGGKR